MKLKVIDYVPHPHDYHVCLDEKGFRVRADLTVSGDLVGISDNESLIGKTVEVECLTPYVSLAHGVQIVGEQQ